MLSKLEQIERVIQIVNESEDVRIIGFTHIDAISKELVDIAYNKNITLIGIGNDISNEVIHESIIPQEGKAYYEVKDINRLTPIKRLFLGKLDTIDNYIELDIQEPIIIDPEA